MTVDARPTDWVIDANHSTFEFAVRHVVVSIVKGAFSGVSGEIHYDPDAIENSGVRVEIDIATLDTHHKGRDEKLLGDGFFDVETHPTATFASTGVQALPDGYFEVTGDLTLRGVTRGVRFVTTFEGPQSQIDGIPRGAFVAIGSIKRTEFGFGLGNDLPGGGKTHSDEVKLAMYVTIRPKPAGSTE